MSPEESDMFTVCSAFTIRPNQHTETKRPPVLMTPPYDARSVANLLLDIAQERFRQPAITNLALQKLLYFTHGHYLVRTGKPLVTGAFEAWTYGPVHPAIYHEFKIAGAAPITVRAIARNVMTGALQALPTVQDDEAERQVRFVVEAYGRLSAGRLVEISHAERGPWWTTVNKAKTSVALGLRISDTVTKECFRFQKVTVGPESRVGEPDDDKPLIRD
ncbi:DUF4065 domain-containing protein [Roseibacterium beibuensis]|uniref:type VI toxin-antitoxin system SocA family antitoxin n=1 Tax=[Roseibacterium] beibuensis TaxID=1193142 RepID=UPI00217F0298|nr:type II toxin-antitoxin system antitoxin SocA domain-containing protein [Roseibacterium beibuensis]MCS6626422.1 DUF4065 domain-containing protein [Roseibacterium beibuensis]